MVCVCPSWSAAAMLGRQVFSLIQTVGQISRWLPGATIMTLFHPATSISSRADPIAECFVQGHLCPVLPASHPSIHPVPAMLCGTSCCGTVFDRVCSVQ